MKTRIIGPAEWRMLPDEATVRTTLLPFVEPENVAVVVVKNDAGEVVGCLTALRVTHLEGMWVRPDYRGNPGVVRSLLRYSSAIAQARGERWVIGGSATDPTLGDQRVGDFIKRLGGVELPVRFYGMRIEEGN